MYEKYLIFSLFSFVTIFSNSYGIINQFEDTRSSSNPDNYLTTPEIIQSHGYVAETHVILTADGYLLQFHRIPCSRNRRPAWRRYPIIFWHGFPSCSIDSIISGPEKGLAYLLAEEGYDVWLANSRGNVYSRRHVTLNPSQKQFWDFSFHEMGIYDVPAAVDYILVTARAEKIIYIGHSLGTTIFYVFASCRPEYNEKILFQISIAPVGAIPRTRSILRYIAPFVPLITSASDIYYKGEFLQHSGATVFLMNHVCGYGILSPPICEKISFSTLYGKDIKQFNKTLIDSMRHHVPAGTSSKTANHAAQLVTNNKFSQYDYGPVGNMEVYKSTRPPEYNISNIDVPIKFYYSKNDILADTLDAKILYQQIPFPMGMSYINYKEWNHIDYLFAINVKEYFYNSLFNFLNHVTTQFGSIQMLVGRELAKRSRTLRKADSTPRTVQVSKYTYFKNKNIFKPIRT